MGTTNSSYRKEKDIENNVISIPTAALKVISDLAEKCICKIKCNTNEVATGFFCAIPYPNKYNRLPVIITNNHVLEESDITIGSNINFSLNNDSTKFTILIDNTRKVYTNVKYDITIIEIKESDKLDINSFLDIDEQIYDNNPKQIYEKKSVYLLHYPHGNISEYAAGLIKNIFEEDSLIHHSCQSQPGSSGSPIINLITHKVLGVHIGSPKNTNSDYNLGTFIKEPINDFNEQMKDTIKNLYIRPINNTKYYDFFKEDFDQEEEYIKKYDIEDENDLKLYQNFFLYSTILVRSKNYKLDGTPVDQYSMANDSSIINSFEIYLLKKKEIWLKNKENAEYLSEKKNEIYKNFINQVILFQETSPPKNQNNLKVTDFFKNDIKSSIDEKVIVDFEYFLGKKKKNLNSLQDDHLSKEYLEKKKKN